MGGLRRVMGREVESGSKVTKCKGLVRVRVAQ